MFCKRLSKSNALPPTFGALEEHVKRVRIQSRVWHQAVYMRQTLFGSLDFGYYQDANGHLQPVTTKIPLAPQSITELVSVGQTVHLKGVPEGDKISLALISVFAVTNVKIMWTPIPAILVTVMMNCEVG